MNYENKINYQKELDILIDNLSENTYKRNTKKSIILHSCCAPCSSYVLTYLTNYFDISVLYYNPNITDEKEYNKRKNEQIKLVNEFTKENKINIIDCDYNTEDFYNISKGLENCYECGERCHKCYSLRLEKTAEIGAKNNFDYFCTTLTISPHKDAGVINRIGKEISQIYNIKWLPSDFKKREGYKKSIELSKKYNLYRQDYCGCEYSIINKI